MNGKVEPRMNDLISIIIPVYQAEKYLKQCLNSVINQNYQNLEIIIIDDGSTDKSLSIIKEYQKKDNRIVLLQQSNKGAGAARNLGLQNAQGDYIGFVDSDDWICQDMFAYLHNLLLKYKADIAGCDFYSCKERSNEKAKENKKKEDKEVLTSMNQRELLQFFFRVNGEKSFYAVWNMLYKKEVLKEVYFPEGKITEDLLFNFKAYSNCRKYILSNCKKYFYFYNPKGVTRKCLGETDLALLRNWDIIIEDTKKRWPDMLKYAELNRYRADFTLLSKAVLYGYYKDEIENTFLDELAEELRNHEPALLKSKMLDGRRKILLIILCINYKLATHCLSFIRKKKYIEISK